MDLTQSTNDNPRASYDWPIKAVPEALIDQIFDKMLICYGTRWTSMWLEVDFEKFRRYWAVKLGEIDQRAVLAGAKALDEYDHPPTLPEFIKLCKEHRPTPENNLALEAPKSKMSRQNADKMLRELDAAGVMKSTDGQYDHKLWAKRIIKRLAAGDKTLKKIQVDFAKEALNIAETA